MPSRAAVVICETHAMPAFSFSLATSFPYQHATCQIFRVRNIRRTQGGARLLYVITPPSHPLSSRRSMFPRIGVHFSPLRLFFPSLVVEREAHSPFRRACIAFSFFEELFLFSGRLPPSFSLSPVLEAKYAERMMFSSYPHFSLPPPRRLVLYCSWPDNAGDLFS